MASTSLVLGLCSILIPLLSIPGFILGVISLGRIKRDPLLSGRGRSITGVITSAILGPLAAIGLVVFIAAGASHLDMARVQVSVRSILQTQTQQETGVLPDLAVRCPKSEPKQAGKVFYCNVVVTETGAPFTAEIRETDNQGDIIIEKVSRTGPAAAPPLL